MITGNLLDRANAYQTMMRIRDQIRTIKSKERLTPEDASNIQKLEREWKTLRNIWIVAVEDNE